MNTISKEFNDLEIIRKESNGDIYLKPGVNRQYIKKIELKEEIKEKEEIRKMLNINKKEVITHSSLLPEEIIEDNNSEQSIIED